VALFQTPVNHAAFLHNRLISVPSGGRLRRKRSTEFTPRAQPSGAGHRPQQHQRAHRRAGGDVDSGVDLSYNGGGPILLALSVAEGSTVEGSRQMLKSSLETTSHYME